VPPLGGLHHWGRVAPPIAALSGSPPKAPGSAGGYLLWLLIIGTSGPAPGPRMSAATAAFRESGRARVPAPIPTPRACRSHRWAFRLAAMASSPRRSARPTGPCNAAVPVTTASAATQRGSGRRLELRRARAAVARRKPIGEPLKAPSRVVTLGNLGHALEEGLDEESAFQDLVDAIERKRFRSGPLMKRFRSSRHLWRVSYHSGHCERHPARHPLRSSALLAPQRGSSARRSKAMGRGGAAPRCGSLGGDRQALD
jgi:hypothetical protein